MIIINEFKNFISYQFTGLILKNNEIKRTVRLERFFVMLDDFEHDEEFAEKLDESRDEFESSEIFKIDESDPRWLLSE